MDVLLSCPWCESDVAVAEDALARDIRCAECAVAFSFAPDVSPARVEREAA